MKKIINSWTKFCSEDISKIEGFDRWLNDTTDTVYDCHHKLEIELCMTRQELKDANMYYDRPASELLILTHSEHSTLHRINMSEEHRRKISEAKKGHIVSEETRMRISESKKNPSEETRMKMREAKKNMSYDTKRKLSERKKESKWWNNGVINKFTKTCPGPDFAPGKLRHK